MNKLKMIELILNNLDYNEMIELLTEGDREYPLYMDELEELMTGWSIMDILQKSFNGYAWNNGRNENRENFNPNSDYFMLNGYENLVSMHEWEAEQYVLDLTMEELEYKSIDELLDIIEVYRIEVEQ